MRNIRTSLVLIFIVFSIARISDAWADVYEVTIFGVPYVGSTPYLACYSGWYAEGHRPNDYTYPFDDAGSCFVFSTASYTVSENLGPIVLTNGNGSVGPSCAGYATCSNDSVAQIVTSAQSGGSGSNSSGSFLGLPSLTADEGAQLAAAIAGVWLVAFGIKMAIRTLTTGVSNHEDD